MKRTAPGLLVLLVVVLSGCAAAGGAPGSSADPSNSGPPSTAPTGGSRDGEGIAHPSGDEPILVVSSEGGFIMVDMLAVQLPSFVLLGDGRVIMAGAQTLEFPGPALQPLQERTLTEEGIQLLLGAIEDTNLFVGGDVEMRGMENMVADASDTVFALNAGGLESTVRVYGLGTMLPDMEPPPNVDQAELEAHEILMRLNDQLMLIDTALPADAWESEGWKPYEPDAFLLHVRDATGEPVDGGDLAEQVREWPTGDDPGAFGEEAANFGNGTRCGVVEGELAATWLAELSESTQMTRWTTDGQDRWTVLARPLLPHEERSCPELAGAG